MIKIYEDEAIRPSHELVTLDIEASLHDHSGSNFFLLSRLDPISNTWVHVYKSELEKTRG